MPFVESNGGAAKRNHSSVSPWLIERPFDVHATSPGAVVGFLDQHRSPQGTHLPLPRLGTQLEPEPPSLTHGDDCRGLHAFRDHLPFLFCYRCVDVQCEMIHVATKLGNDEVHLAFHEPSDEVHVSGQSVETRDYEWTAPLARLLERCSQAWSQQDRIFSGTGLDVAVPGCDAESLALAKVLNVEALSSQTQSASTLFLGADS